MSKVQQCLLNQASIVLTSKFFFKGMSAQSAKDQEVSYLPDYEYSSLLCVKTGVPTFVNQLLEQDSVYISVSIFLPPPQYTKK